MNKNKLLSFLLAGGLLVGGTFLGTKALFSDKETSTNTLRLTTGKVDIKVSEQPWLRNVQDKNGDGEITVLDKPYDQKCESNDTGVFENVQPGDTFTRYINILNEESTYNVLINIAKSLDVTNENLIKHIELNANNLLSGVQELPAKANSGGYITVKIKNCDEAWKDFNGAGEFDINSVFEITATQKEK